MFVTKFLTFGRNKGEKRPIRLADRKMVITKTARPPVIEKKYGWMCQCPYCSK